MKKIFQNFLKKKIIFFHELVNERSFEVNKLSEEIVFIILTYYCTSKSVPKYFVCFKGPLIICNDKKNFRISLQKEEKIQEELQSELKEILKGNPNYKSEDQRSTITNIYKLYNGQE